MQSPISLKILQYSFPGSAGTCFFKVGIVPLDPSEAILSEVTPVYSTITTDDTLTVLTPNAGTIITLVGDGTFWLLNGTVVSEDRKSTRLNSSHGYNSYAV